MSAAVEVSGLARLDPNSPLNMGQAAALFDRMIESGGYVATKKPDSLKSSSPKPKTASPKPTGSEPKEDTADADAAQAAATEMAVCVDLYLQDKDEDFKFGGHTLMAVQSEWGLHELCDAVSHKFKSDQKLPMVKRPNLAAESVWSDTHKVKKIASVSKNAINSQWDTTPIDKSWIFSEENCTHLLRAMEQHRAPEALAVYISRNKYEDCIY